MRMEDECFASLVELVGVLGGPFLQAEGGRLTDVVSANEAVPRIAKRIGKPALPKAQT